MCASLNKTLNAEVFMSSFFGIYSQGPITLDDLNHASRLVSTSNWALRDILYVKGISLLIGVTLNT